MANYQQQQGYGAPPPSQYIQAPLVAVVVKDVEMPFWSIVLFMLKFALASIPAGIVIFGVFGALFMAMMTVGAALTR